jgi:mono/diheme cytochrome c family protein
MGKGDDSMQRKRFPTLQASWGAALLVLFMLTASQTAAETAAERGYRALLTVPLLPSTLTEQEYFDLWQFWPEPDRSRAAQTTEEERRKMLLARYGFQESPDRPGPVPQQFTSDGKGNLSENCLACHGGPVAGKVVRGLGNSLIDLTTFAEDLARMHAAKGITPPPLPPPMAALNIPGAPARGLNNAWGAAIAYMLVRDRDLNLTDGPQFTQPTPAQIDIPLKTPPYWLSKKKTRYYYDAFIGKSHRDIMQFTFDPAMPAQQIFGFEAVFKDIYAWINAVEAPKYPFPIDRALSRRGLRVFIRDCAACHGTYGPGGRYPERLVAAEEVGTDPVRARDFPVAFKEHLGASWTGDYGKTPLYPQTNSYLAPPLDGIWANVPYLHNGSVPTMWDLLSPDSRPAIWRRTDAGYDQTKLGLEITTYDELPADATTPEHKRLYYQASLRGLSNQGHRYPPQGLSDEEKRVLIEYLKTL